MAETSTKVKEPSEEQNARERIQGMRGRQIYQLGSELEVSAFASIGLHPDDLPDNSHYKINFSTYNLHPRKIKLVLSNDYQLRINSYTTRGIELSETHNSEPSFAAGRFFEPDGGMWIAADSSQGDPWYNRSLSPNTLLSMVDGLETLGQSDYELKICFSAFRHIVSQRSN